MEAAKHSGLAFQSRSRNIKRIELRLSRRLPLLVMLTATAGLFAQTPRTPRSPLTPTQLAAIDTLVTAEMAHEQIPGLEVGVYSRGTVLLAKGYGPADVELNVPVKPETVFQSGSVGKQFVSAAIMMLVVRPDSEYQ